MPATPVPSDKKPNVPNQKTFYDILTRNSQRLNTLERASRLGSASIGEGGITVYNQGSIRFFLDSGTGNPGKIFADFSEPDRRFLRLYGPSTATDPTKINDSRISLEGATPTDPAHTFIYGEGDGGRVTLNADDGQITLHSSVLFHDSNDQFINTGLGTTGSSPNLFMDIADDGRVLRFVSSARYKTDIADSVVDPVEVLQLVGRTFRIKEDVERENGSGSRTGLAGSDPVEDFTAPTLVGFIAEELHELPTMRQFVNYDNEGRPDSISYDRLTVALAELCKAQQKQLDSLEERLSEVEGRIQP